MKIIITSHTEFKNKTDKSILRILDGTLNIAKKHCAKISFALMPEIVNKKIISEIINEDQEIGLHIHPDDAYLIKKGISDAKSVALRDYSYETQREMIGAGKNLIIRTCGIEPKVFIAGKWSENNETIKALENLSFTHDCTPNPGFTSKYCDWKGLHRISMPYYPSAKNYKKYGKRGVLMVPISKTITNAGVSPESAPFVGLGFLKACFEEYYSQKMPVFHIYFHSCIMASEYHAKILDNFLEYISGHEKIYFEFPSKIKEKTITKTKTSIFPYLKNINKEILSTSLKKII